MRELVLGDVISSVCFAYGRNLVATLRNHIILIEAATYLPAEYLQKLLKYADEANMSDPEPEKPMPLKSGEGSSSAASRKSKESEVSQVGRFLEVLKLLSVFHFIKSCGQTDMKFQFFSTERLRITKGRMHQRGVTLIWNKLFSLLHR